MKFLGMNITGMPRFAGKGTRRGGSGKASLTRRRRLAFEPLEDRRLLSATPTMLADVNAGALSSRPGEFVEVNGNVFFKVEYSPPYSNLWMTDGTPAGTSAVNPEGVSVRQMATANDKLFFTSGSHFITNNETVRDTQLWISDGTVAGTEKLIEIDPSSDWHRSRSVITGLTDVNGALFFTLDHPYFGRELWKSDGTIEGTGMVKDIRPGYYFGEDPIGSGPSDFTNVNGTLFFTAYHPDYGRELWKTDGTEAGTVLVKDIAPGPTDTNLSWTTNVAGTLFFVAEDHLWKTDGSEEGTVVVYESGPALMGVLRAHGGTLIFRDANGVWATDGSEAGTARIVDLTETYYSPRLRADTGGKFFFTMSDHRGDIMQESLWATDGTAAGTTLLVDTVEGWSFSDMTDVGGTLFMIRQSSDYEYELWKSDGTKAGTMRVKQFDFDLYDGTSYARRPDDFVAASNRLFFTYDDGVHGRELWTSDGTSTILVADTNPGAGDSVSNWAPLAGLTNLGGSLYYAGDNGQTGFEPWVLDTTHLFTTIQIDAGLDRGSINVAANGAIAVSVLTTADFDAARVDVATVDFAGASAFQSDLLDLDGDGDLDLLLHFRVEDTMLRGIYAQLLADDLDADGVLDSRNQLAEVALAGLTLDEELFEGHDSLSLSLSGRALRELLDDLFPEGVV